MIVEEGTHTSDVGGGLHLMGEWHGCQAPLRLFADVDEVRHACIDAATAANLTVVGDRFHVLPDQGVTGMVLLAESHLAIRTWPQAAKVALDVFVCNHRDDNRDKARILFAGLHQLYRPTREELFQVRRGGAMA